MICVEFSGKELYWELSHGISLETTLKSLESINKKPSTLAGFGWEFGGTVYSWEGGSLEQPFENVTIQFEENSNITTSEANKIVGDKGIESRNAIMKKMNPKTVWIFVSNRIPLTRLQTPSH